MAKISKEKMQQDERKILAELRKNSNKSIDMIAKDCGFSRQKVWRAVKQFEAEGLIWGYTAILDTTRQGLEKFILLLKRTPAAIEKTTAEDIASGRFKKMYDDFGITIESSYYTHGEYDWAIIFTAKNINYAKKFCDTLAANYPNLISKKSLNQILYTQRELCILNPKYKRLLDLI